MRLLGRAHGGLQQILDGDLVPQGLVEQPLAGRQLAVGQDLDLCRERAVSKCVKALKTEDAHKPARGSKKEEMIWEVLA